MLTGWILLLMVGGCWTVIGITLTFARRSGCRGELFFLIGSVVAALLTLLALLALRELRIPEGEGGRITAIAVGAGLNACSQFLTMRNLGRGGCALYFALSRMGFAVSFLWCAAIWGEKVSVWNGAGILCLIVTVVLSARNKNREGEAVERVRNGRLMMALLSTCCAGASQICVIWPSIHAAENGPGLHPLMSALILFLANCVCFGIWAMIRRSGEPILWRPVMRIGGAWGLAAFASYALLFPTLNWMGRIGKAGIVYPVAGAVMIFVYALYTRFFLGERLDLRQKIALGLIVAGIFAVRMG